MFDNLRDDSSFYEEEPSDLYKEPEVQAKPAPARRRRRRSARFMGLTAQQRFFLAFMLLITVCVMGMLAMFVTGRMGLF
ncbi:MAG: hypothetical protein ACM3PS_00200 [Syntrophothermus sp.]